MEALTVILFILLSVMSYDRYQTKKRYDKLEFLLLERKQRDIEALSNMFLKKKDILERERVRQISELEEKYKKDTRFKVWSAVTDKKGFPNRVILISPSSIGCEEMLWKECSAPKGTYKISEIRKDVSSIALLTYDIL